MDHVPVAAGIVGLSLHPEQIIYNMLSMLIAIIGTKPENGQEKNTAKCSVSISLQIFLFLS